MAGATLAWYRARWTTIAPICDPWPTALVTLRNTLFRVFSCFLVFSVFSQIQAALPYPFDRFGRLGRNTRKTLLYGF